MKEDLALSRDKVCNHLSRKLKVRRDPTLIVMLRDRKKTHLNKGMASNNHFQSSKKYMNFISSMGFLLKQISALN